MMVSSVTDLGENGILKRSGSEDEGEETGVGVGGRGEYQFSGGCFTLRQGCRATSCKREILARTSFPTCQRHCRLTRQVLVESHRSMLLPLSIVPLFRAPR